MALDGHEGHIRLSYPHHLTRQTKVAPDILGLLKRDLTAEQRTSTRTSLVLEALMMALVARQPGRGPIVLSDRGAQGGLNRVARRLRRCRRESVNGACRGVLGRRPSPGSVCGFKNELVHPIGAFTTRHEATLQITRYIRWHNTTPRHSVLDMLAPATWERAHTLTCAA